MCRNNVLSTAAAVVTQQQKLGKLQFTQALLALSVGKVASTHLTTENLFSAPQLPMFSLTLVIFMVLVSADCFFVHEHHNIAKPQDIDSLRSILKVKHYIF